MNTIRCNFREKKPCHWLRDGWKCGYPPKSGPHLWDGKRDTYRAITVDDEQ